MNIVERIDSRIINFLAGLYLLELVIVNQFQGVAIHIGWIITVTLSSIGGLYSIHYKLSRKHILAVIITMITGLCNFLFVGSIQFSEIIMLTLFYLVALILCSDKLNAKTPLFIFYLNAIVVIYKFMTVGFWGQIYNTSSSNFVSVFLLYPLVIYYTHNENNKRDIRLFPAVVYWVLCLFSRGRMGIMCASLFFAGIFFVKNGLSKNRKKAIIFLISVATVMLALTNIDNILNMIDNSLIFEYFQSRGLESSSRMRIWGSYFESLTSIKEIVLGTNWSNTYIGYAVNGNPHNSYMNIHMLNGLMMLLYVVVCLVKSIVWSVAMKRPIFFICLITIMIRAFSDRVFWPTYGTPILFFLMMFSSSSAVLTKTNENYH